MERRVMTIGHGGRQLDDLINLVVDAGATTIVDVRSQPYSRYQPEFSQGPLRAAALSQGLTYVFLGRELGGRPEDPSLYDDGRVNYGRLCQHPPFVEGLQRLIDGLRKGYQPALVCSELHPEACHRSKAIGVALETRGVQVEHIDADGRTVPQQTVLDRLDGGQLSLIEPTYRSLGRYLAEDDD